MRSHISDHSKEIELIIDCCRTTLPAAVSERISKTLDDPINWKFALNVAQRNAVLPLFGRSLVRGFSRQLPAEIKSVLEREEIRHLHHNLFQTQRLIELVKFFDTNNIKVLPFKGPALAIEAYGDPGYRTFNDLDVLVQPKQFRKAVELLTDNGWKPITSASWLTKRNWNISRKKDIYFVDPDGLVNLELHWKLSGSHFGLPKEINTLWERLESIELAGTRLPALGINDLLIYLCLHGSRHSWERFGWICDIHQLILSKDSIDWKQLYIDSGGLGSEKVVALGLRLIRDFFGFEVPDKGWQNAISDPVFAEMSREIKARLFTPESTAVEIGERYLNHLKLKERSFDRFKLHYHYLTWYSRIILTPNEVDRNALMLPRVLDPLYYLTRPVRLLYNYVRKPKVAKIC